MMKSFEIDNNTPHTITITDHKKDTVRGIIIEASGYGEMFPDMFDTTVKCIDEKGDVIYHQQLTHTNFNFVDIDGKFNKLPIPYNIFVTPYGRFAIARKEEPVYDTNGKANYKTNYYRFHVDADIK